MCWMCGVGVICVISVYAGVMNDIVGQQRVNYLKVWNTNSSKHLYGCDLDYTPCFHCLLASKQHE